MTYEQSGKMKKHITLYHGTSHQYLPMIIKNGVISKFYSDSTYFMFSTDIRSAILHSKITKEGYNAPVLEFHIPASEKEYEFWEGYPYFYEEYKRKENSSWFSPKKKIPQKFIHKIHYITYSDYILPRIEEFKKNGNIKYNLKYDRRYN
jgi:hypothetical protein